MRKAFALIEIIVVIGLLTALISVATYIFQVVLWSWASHEARAGVETAIDRAMNAVSRDAREASVIGQKYQHELRFTVKNRLSDGTPIDGSFSHYIYYFYNAGDAYPSNFTQASYDLKRAPLGNVTGSDLTTGTFTYGSGQFVADGVIPPATSDLAIAGSIVTADISIKKGNETVRARTRILPRNL